MWTPTTSAVPFDLVIFDCDGVLVDSEVIACRAVADALHAIGHSISAESVSERFNGMSNKDMYAVLGAEIGGPLPVDFDGDMNIRAAARFERELRAMPGLEAVLAQLSQAKCVASSSTPKMLADKLRWTGLVRWFEDATFSTALVARGKPAPDIFLHAAQRMGAAIERCLVGGQRRRDHRGKGGGNGGVRLHRWQPLPRRSCRGPRRCRCRSRLFTNAGTAGAHRSAKGDLHHLVGAGAARRRHLDALADALADERARQR